ncbi:MAG: coproporphyrinogen dehydrogenase HemZ [Ruminococcaceae bacterium]|nr:coproporphyrinogen dehydrogenase HemZ [Oscillospiraceae bacterium]
MILKNINHDCAYHTQKLATMFFPLEKISDGGDSDIVVITEKNGDKLTVCARVYSEEHTLSRIMTSDDTAREMSLLMYEVLSKVTGFRPPWGILYGVRPARLMHATVEKLGEKAARQKFTDDLVTKEKTDLALEVMESENRIISLSGDRSFSLYISVPFCPTRCSYCSFVSHSIQNADNLIEPYVNLLCRELEKIAKTAKALDLRLESVYVGGGTPTTLTAVQLERVISTVNSNFDVTTCRELTVEAGRPDTVTEEKLKVLRACGVDRVSINPQTFSDEVRKKAGRHHTTQQTLDAFALARKVGFDNINMDFIAGLAGEDVSTFANGIKKATALGAESITVHNLALKSAAFLVTEGEYYDLTEKLAAADMVHTAYALLTSNGYKPYYMYRQSKSLGNLENVGYAKEGKECLYNVFMMDETHSVFAAGAGAVTKLKGKTYNNIERVYNYKYPYEYIANFDEVLSRKQKILDFYHSNMN